MTELQCKINNKFGFPKPIVHWLKQTDYDLEKEEGIISATELMKPVRMFWLTRIHQDNVEIDILDLIASRYGEAIHNSFAKADYPDAIQEQRFTRPLNITGEDVPIRITGKPDMLLTDEHHLPGKDTLHLVDIKSTSVWTYIFSSKLEDYITQLSIYRWILNVNPELNIDDDATIYYIFTDWKQSDAKRKDDYPNSRIAVQKITLMSLQETEEYIRERVDQIMAFSELGDKGLPYCTTEELWQQPDKWAVMKEGRKSAVRVFGSEDDAKEWIKPSTRDLYIEHRPGKVHRCNYCLVRSVCDQYKKLQEEGLIDD